MTTRVLALLAVLFVAGGLAAAIVSSSLTVRAVAAMAASVGVFVLGVGVGERSNAAYCRELTRINRLLAGLVEDFSDSNLSKLSPRRAHGDPNLMGGPHKPASAPLEGPRGDA